MNHLRKRFERRYVPTDEGHVSYFHRRGETVPLVLIPGSFSDAYQWTGLLEHLPESFHLLLAELRGHGESWPPPENGSIEQFAADVFAMTNDAGLETFFVGGHSIGGMVAIEMARVNPGRLRGVFSFEGWTHHKAARDAFAGDMASTLSDNLKAHKKANRARLTARWTDNQISAFGSIWRNWDGEKILQTTNLPVWEVYGDRGKPRPSKESLRIPDRPNIRIIWVENVSHDLPLECPHILADILLQGILNT